MGQLWITAAKKPPLTTMILDAWLGMSQLLPDMRLNKELKPAIDHLYRYAEASLADNGIEQLGPAELCLRNPRAIERLTMGPDPIFKPEQISKKKILFYAVQLAGSPLLGRYMDGDQERDGPADILRQLPTHALRSEWGDNSGALQRVALIAQVKGNKTVYSWALNKAHIINEALLEFAEENQLVGYMRKISVRQPKRSKQQWAERFEELKATRDGRTAEERATPAEALEAILVGKNPGPNELTAMFTLLANRLEKVAPGILAGNTNVQLTGPAEALALALQTVRVQKVVARATAKKPVAKKAPAKKVAKAVAA